MDEVVIPAEEAGSSNAEPVVAETPTATEAEVAPSEASRPAEQPSVAATEPDLSALLKDPKVRQQLLKDPELLREIDHRASSEAGRRAKAQLEAWQQQQAKEAELRRQEAEIAELEQLDEYEVGTRTKQQLTERRQQIEQQRQATLLEQREHEIRAKLEVDLLGKLGSKLFGTAHKLAQQAGATEQEMAQIDPSNYPDEGAYFEGLVKFLSVKEGKKLAKELAKTEAAAMLEEHNATARESNPAPAVLPAAEAAISDDAFTAAYANGRSNSTGRQIEWMKQNGIL